MFRKAAKFFGVPLEIVELPFKDRKLIVIFRLIPGKTGGCTMDTNRRRMMMGTAAALAGSFLAGLLRPGTLLAAWNQQAFDAKNLQDALQTLGMGGAVQSRDIVIDAPDVAENGASVPVQITSRIPGTRSIAIFVDRNPWPHIARFEFAQDTLPFVALRLRVAETSPVRVVVRARESYYVAAKDVSVVAGGCGGPGEAEAAPVPTRAEPIKVQGAKAGDRFTLTWRDNKGLTRTDEATVSG